MNIMSRLTEVPTSVLRDELERRKKARPKVVRETNPAVLALCERMFNNLEDGADMFDEDSRKLVTEILKSVYGNDVITWLEQFEDV